MARCEELIQSYRKIQREMELHSKTLVRKFGVTAPQTSVLQAASTLEHPTVGEISRSLNLSPATVTSIVDRLELLGYVKREKFSSDKRKVKIRVTAEGRVILSRPPPLMKESFLKKFQEMQDCEQILAISTFQRIANMMEEER